MNALPIIITLAICACFPAFALLFACCKVSHDSGKSERARAAAREKLRLQLWRDMLT